MNDPVNPFAKSVVVVGVGARTAIGLTGPATAAAARAGIAGFENHPFMVDTAGKRMIVAAAPYLSMDLTYVDRLAELAVPAAIEAVAVLAKAADGKKIIPVFVGLPPSRPGRPKNATDAIVARIRMELSSHYRVANVVPIETGHAGGTMALQAAWEAVRSGSAEFALAGGVDSYMEPETLEWLEANDQLHSSGEENNPYGFIPGEAGGFVLLASADAAERLKLYSALEVRIVAAARETNLIKTDSVCRGEGLIALFRTLSGDPPTTRVDHLYCDMNGEPYRADEFGFATIRVGKLFRDPSSFTTPADCWGDVGAASGPLLLLAADAATRKGYAHGPVLAGFTSAESGERCGFVVRSRIDQGVR
jgi:3-oxoacyl-[acyl-carrier-protein] synthase-1